MATPASFWKKYRPMIPPKSAPNSDFLGMHLELMYLAWIGIVPNSTILLVHISIHPKIILIAKDNLFGNCAERFSNGALILIIKFYDLHTLFNTMTFHSDLPYTTKQFTTNLTDVILTTWLLWSNKFRAFLLKDPIINYNESFLTMCLTWIISRI